MTEKLILIDLTKPRVAVVSHDYTALRYWAALLCDPDQYRIQPLSGRHFSPFSQQELCLMYGHARGQSGKFTSYDEMLKATMHVIDKMEVDCTPVTELVERLGRTLEAPKDLRRSSGVKAAEIEPDPEVPAETPPAAPAEDAAPAPPHKGRQTARETMARAPVADAAPKPPKEPRAKRDPADASGRPAAGSKTGQVWDIADKLLTKNKKVDKLSKEFKKLVVDACVAAGINQSTAGVQFAKWAKS